MSPNSHCKHTHAQSGNITPLVGATPRLKPQQEGKIQLDPDAEKHLIECLTWQGKKGENSERDHTQLCESILHSNDINQDLL